MMKLSTLETGFFHSDGGSMFGLLPKNIWSRQYPADDNNLCMMGMRCLLFQNNDRIILFDTGCGNKEDLRMVPYRFRDLKNLTSLLSEKGISPFQVTDIVLSHLHFDHCGGLTVIDESGSIQPVFPNARVHVSRVQWDHHLNPGLLDEDAYFSENTNFLKNNPLLNLIDSECRLTDEISLSLYDGHTPGQIVSFIQTENGKSVFAGDVIPMALNLHLESIPAFDLHAEKSVTERLKLLEHIVTENASVYFYHDVYTSECRLRKAGKRFIPVK